MTDDNTMANKKSSQQEIWHHKDLQQDFHFVAKMLKFFRILGHFFARVSLSTGRH